MIISSAVEGYVKYLEIKSAPFEYETVVCLGGVPLSLWAANFLEGRQVSLQWWIADAPLSEAERVDVIAKMAMGLIDAEWTPRYSCPTGYLWTDEGFQVGGHDILNIMSNNVDKWCRLEVVIHSD